MITATLGGLIKDYRIKKRLSQFDVSLRIGWKDTSRLSKIEQGRVGKPTRETIEKIIKALGLNEQEKGQLLYAGSYVPTDEEIESIIKKVKTKIDNWHYPAYLMDFSWRQLYTNNITIDLFKLQQDWKKIERKSKPNVLEAPFLPKNILKITLQKGEDEVNLKPFTIAHIATFKTVNHRFQHELWYKKLIQSLMKYKEFRRLWPIVGPDYEKSLEYEYKEITGIYDGRKRTFKLHMFVIGIINDPRFDLIFYTPADRDTDEYCQKLMTKAKKENAIQGKSAAENLNSQQDHKS